MGLGLGLGLGRGRPSTTVQRACTPLSTDALIWWAVSTAVARAAAMRDGCSSSAPG